MGSDVIIVVFAIVVIGGMGSIMGAIVSGSRMGVVEGLTGVFYPAASSTVDFPHHGRRADWRARQDSLARRAESPAVEAAGNANPRGRSSRRPRRVCLYCFCSR